MGISLDGLASGLDTTALISSLMQSEALPQTLLKNKSYDIQSMVSALQGLNGKVAALATQATAAAKPGALDLYHRDHQQRQSRRHHHRGGQGRFHRLPGHQAGPDPGHRDAQGQRRDRLALHHHDHQQRRQGLHDQRRVQHPGRRRHRGQRRRRRRHRHARSTSAAETSGSSSPPRSPAAPARSRSPTRAPTLHRRQGRRRTRRSSLWPRAPAAPDRSRPRPTPSPTCCPASRSPPRTSPPRP